MAYLDYIHLVTNFVHIYTVSKKRTNFETV